MKWKDLRHNGIAFPPAYESKQLSIRIRGKEVRLSTEAEELAYAWGKKRATPYVQDPVFQSNFLSDFARLLPSEYRGIKYSENDWTPVHEYHLGEEQQKSDPVVKKKLDVQRKELRLTLKQQYGYADLDGVRPDTAS